MKWRTMGLALSTVLLTACSAQTPEGPAALNPTSPVDGTPTQDAATRTAPVVPGRPGRVFVFAGVDDSCKALAEPQISISQAPQKGDISFRPGQTTSIAASKNGKCLGATASGTGVYYTARDGTSGSDIFTLTARLATGETMTRTFAVTIAP